MTSDEAAVTLLLKGKPQEFSKEHAKRLLDLQGRTGMVDYTEPTEEELKAIEAPQPTTENADNGPTGDSVNKQPKEPKGTKTGV